MDETLRTLERAAESGSVEDAARLLTERVRSGTLARHRLQVAAYCEHLPAVLAMGLEPKKPHPLRAIIHHDEIERVEADEYAAWVKPLCEFLRNHPLREEFARDVGVRAIVAAAAEVVSAEKIVGRDVAGVVVALGQGWLASQGAARSRIVSLLRASPEVVIRHEGKRTKDAWWVSITSAVLWIEDERSWPNQVWPTLVEDALLSAGESARCTRKVGDGVRAALVTWALE